MSADALFAVMRAAKSKRLHYLTGIERHVLATLADYQADGAPGCAFMAMSTLAETVGHSENRVRDAVHALLQRGLVLMGDRKALGSYLGKKHQEVPMPYTVALHHVDLQNVDPQGVEVQRSESGTPPRGGPGTPPRGPKALRSSSYGSTSSRRSARDGSGPVLEVAPKSEPRPKAKAEKAAHPRHQEVMDHWFKAHERKRGQPPVSDGRTGTSVRNLLAKIPDADEVKRRIDNLLGDAFASNRTIHDLARDPDRWLLARTDPNAFKPLVKRQQGMATPIIDAVTGQAVTDW